MLGWVCVNVCSFNSASRKCAFKPYVQTFPRSSYFKSLREKHWDDVRSPTWCTFSYYHHLSTGSGWSTLLGLKVSWHYSWYGGPILLSLTYCLLLFYRGYVTIAWVVIDTLYSLNHVCSPDIVADPIMVLCPAVLSKFSPTSPFRKVLILFWPLTHAHGVAVHKDSSIVFYVDGVETRLLTRDFLPNWYKIMLPMWNTRGLHSDVFRGYA